MQGDGEVVGEDGVGAAEGADEDGPGGVSSGGGGEAAANARVDEGVEGGAQQAPRRERVVLGGRVEREGGAAGLGKGGGEGGQGLVLGGEQVHGAPPRHVLAVLEGDGGRVGAAGGDGVGQALQPGEAGEAGRRRERRRRVSKPREHGPGGGGRQEQGRDAPDGEAHGRHGVGGLVRHQQRRRSGTPARRRQQHGEHVPVELVEVPEDRRQRSLQRVEVGGERVVRERVRAPSGGRRARRVIGPELQLGRGGGPGGVNDAHEGAGG